jgi:NADH-quinone oxidoreductase subunit C
MTDSAQTTPAERLTTLAENLNEQFGAMGCETASGYNEVTLTVPADKLLEVSLTLRDHEDFAFEQLMDLCGVDYARYGSSEWDTEEASSTGFGRGVDRDGEVEFDPAKRFAVVCHLLSVARNTRLRLKTFAVGEPPVVDSLIDVWNSANWFEREAFDLYGILFNGQPDLRRILTDYGFIGHPFRKDFPLVGQVEMRYDPAQQRVIYEPVNIEPRTLVPRVIREDNRYLSEQDATDA